MQQADESLSLSKKTAAKGKGKATNNGGHSGNTPVFDDIPMRALPLPSPSSRDLSGTPEPSSSSSGQRKGFAPVQSFSSSNNGNGGGSEGGGETPKFAPISVAVKRKATEQGEGSPASKRRG